MKTVIKALTERRVVDGWGVEYTLRRPTLIPGGVYLGYTTNVNDVPKCTIIKQLDTQEKVIGNSKNLNLLSPEGWSYKKYL